MMTSKKSERELEEYIKSNAKGYVTYEKLVKFLPKAPGVNVAKKIEACMGWPVSSITKFVISTILLMGRIPEAVMAFFIHSGDSFMRRFLSTGTEPHRRIVVAYAKEK